MASDRSIKGTRPDPPTALVGTWLVLMGLGTTAQAQCDNNSPFNTVDCDGNNQISTGIRVAIGFAIVVFVFAFISAIFGYRRRQRMTGILVTQTQQTQVQYSYDNYPQYPPYGHTQFPSPPPPGPGESQRGSYYSGMAVPGAAPGGGYDRNSQAWPQHEYAPPVGSPPPAHLPQYTGLDSPFQPQNPPLYAYAQQRDPTESSQKV